MRPLPLGATPWLIVSDIHWDPGATDAFPSGYESDTNTALLASAIAEMKRADRDAPVVLITGDFLAHHFHYERAEATMRALARRFDAAFPHAQFVIALGNEDSACGDYELSVRAPFLRTVAAAWRPLVNRRGAAPGFARSFAADGFYSAALPVAGLRAVVIDDVFWSPRYRAACGGTGGDRQTQADLRAALRAAPHGRNWVIAHIPPGIDAYSTAHLGRGLVVVPFLNAQPRKALVALVNDPRSHVALVLTAHTHKFAFRIDGEGGASAAPMLLVPAISPIFSNAPSFLTVDVRADGTVASADDHAFLDGRWQTIGGTKTLGLHAVTGPELRALQKRLARDPALRRQFARLYNGGAPPEIDESNWRSYWCAATAFSIGAFSSCAGHAGGISVITRRGVVLIAAIALAVICVGSIAVARRLRHAGRRRRTKPS